MCGSDLITITVDLVVLDLDLRGARSAVVFAAQGWRPAGLYGSLYDPDMEKKLKLKSLCEKTKRPRRSSRGRLGRTPTRGAADPPTLPPLPAAA
jgi:hypothetical protein